MRQMNPELQKIADELTNHPDWTRMEDQDLKKKWVQEIRRHPRRSTGALFDRGRIDGLLDPQVDSREVVGEKLYVPLEKVEDCPKCLIGCLLPLTEDFRIFQKYDTFFGTQDIYLEYRGSVIDNESVPYVDLIPMNESVIRSATVREALVAIERANGCFALEDTLAWLSDLTTNEGLDVEYRYSSDELADFVDAIL